MLNFIKQSVCWSSILKYLQDVYWKQWLLLTLSPPGILGKKYPGHQGILGNEPKNDMLTSNQF